MGTQIIRLARPSAPCDWLTGQVPELIDALGKPGFEAQLFAAVSGAVGCDLIHAVTLGERHEERMIFLAGHPFPTRRDRELRRARPKWDLEALLAVQKSETPLDDGLLISGSPDGLGGSPAHLWPVGEAMQAADRPSCESLAVVRRHRDLVICVSFHRHATTGPFGIPEFRRLQDASDLLIALVAKHQALLPKADSPAELRRHCEDLLRDIAPVLSQREREVCACIATGLSSTAIALTLGIKLNTVLTHRKHAYNRLKISSQNELLRKVLTSPAEPPATHGRPRVRSAPGFELRTFPVAV